MKKIIGLFAMLCILQNTVAQNWKVININDKYNYTANNTYYTIFTDSAKEINGDSVLFLNTVTRRVRPYTPAKNRYLSKESQFFLSKINYKSEDVIMQKNDSVKFLIKPYSKLNDTWVFDSLRHDTAKVIDISTTTIFGNTDSIKIIKLSNSDTIILSKNYGILKFPFYDSLPQHVTLVGIEGRNLGQLIPKFIDFFDFNIGDVFYYKKFTNEGRLGYGTIYKKITIKSKLVQSNKITYTYDYSHKKDFFYYNLKKYVITYSAKKDSVISYTDDPSDYLNKFPNQAVGGTDYINMLKPVNTFNDQKWQTITKSYSFNSFCKFSTDTIYESEEVHCTNNSIKVKTGMMHGKGIGHIIIDSWGTGGIVVYSVTETLVGYKRNGKVTGDVFPDSIFLAIPQYSSSTTFKVYQNSEKNNFTIEGPENTGAQDIYIFDVRGVLMMERQMNGKIEIDISNLSNGIYFIKIVSKETFKVFKILKQ